jgi:hypothetical protein
MAKYQVLVMVVVEKRENDGPAMISIWRINMIDFFNNNHNKYLILGHIILSGMLYNT